MTVTENQPAAAGSQLKDGRVVAIAGPVVDVEFPRGSLPEINTALEFTVNVDGKDVDLTTNEFQLLQVLLSNAGIVFSRDALLHRVWKDQAFVTVRSVDTLVKRLRKKIERNPSEPSVILTVWGAGYKAADV